MPTRSSDPERCAPRDVLCAGTKNVYFYYLAGSEDRKMNIFDSILTIIVMRNHTPSGNTLLHARFFFQFHPGTFCHHCWGNLILIVRCGRESEGKACKAGMRSGRGSMMNMPKMRVASFRPPTPESLDEDLLGWRVKKFREFINFVLCFFFQELFVI